MIDYFVNNFSDYIWIAIILIAMIPSLEGRIALPFALSLSNFGIEEIPVIVAFLCTFVGSIIPCLPVIVLCRAVKKRSSGFLYDKMISRLNFNTSETEKNKQKKHLY